MELNNLEKNFFDWILTADLDVPVRATFEYEGRTFDCIIVPEIDQEGYFTLKYYNAFVQDSTTQTTGSGSDSKMGSIFQDLGLDPLLERAWLNGDPVAVLMHPAPLPIRPGPGRKLDVAVQYASTGNSGGLVLHESQAIVQNTPIKKAQFSLVGFPDFRSPIGQLSTIALIGSPVYEDLKTASAKLGDEFTVKIQSSPRRVDLDSGDGWSIRLGRDEKPTRNLVSHTGLIERNDGKECGSEELNDVLQALKYFFAFSAGAYCNPTVVVGFDSQDRPTFGKVSRFEMAPRPLPNWFNRGSLCFDAALQDLFPGFWRKWKKNKYEIIAVIECYVHSNVMRQSGVPNDAVAKSYSGLETLAGLILGETLTRDSHSKIRGVLCDKQIPHIELDSSKTPVMAKLCGDLNVGDLSGSHLLGNVRNYVSHPLDPRTPAEVKERHRKYLDSDRSRYAYLHDLSQFYLEYAFLKFCDYQTSENRKLLETMQEGSG